MRHTKMSDKCGLPVQQASHRMWGPCKAIWQVGYWQADDARIKLLTHRLSILSVWMLQSGRAYASSACLRCAHAEAGRPQAAGWRAGVVCQIPFLPSQGPQGREIDMSTGCLLRWFLTREGFRKARQIKETIQLGRGREPPPLTVGQCPATSRSGAKSCVCKAGHVIRRDKRTSAPQDMETHLVTLMALASLALGAAAQACHTMPQVVLPSVHCLRLPGVMAITAVALLMRHPSCSRCTARHSTLQSIGLRQCLRMETLQTKYMLAFLSVVAAGCENHKGTS